MATVEIDIIEESSLKLTSRGYEKTRVAKVSGLTGNDSAREQEAILACPSRGTVHPDISTIRVDELAAKAEGRDLVTVKILYRTPTGASLQVGDTPQLEISGSIEMATTDMDKDGNLLKISFSGDDKDPAIPEYVAEAQYPRPHGLVRFSRRESITASQAQQLVNTYVGTTNSAAFGPFSARTLLMARITCRSDDNGDTFLVTYEMGHERKTWDARLKAVGKDGKIPAGIVLGDGLIVREISGTSNYSNLNL